MAKVLVVDDRATNRDVIATVLGHRGHTTVEAADGLGALAIAKAESPDLIISDILMPSMDGFELVRRLRADKATCDTPVIFCTAHYLNREADSFAKAVGVNRILYKPLDPETVLVTVDDALGKPVTAKVTADSGTLDREHLRLLNDKLRANVDALQASNGKLNALVDLTVALSSAFEEKEILDRLCHVAREIFAARLVAGGLERGGDRVPMVSHGSASAARGGGEEPFSPAAWQVVRAIIRRQQARRWPARSPEVGELLRCIFPGATADGSQALLLVPIALHACEYGWLCMAGKLGDGEFTEEDEGLAIHLATLVARIHDNGRLYREAEQRAQALENEMARRETAEQSRRTLEQQLFQAQKSEALGALAGGMAHDINNSLVPIMTMAPLARRLAPQDGLEQQCLALIEKAGTRIRDLVRRILAFSRQHDLPVGPINLVDAFKEAIELLRVSVPTRVEVRSVVEPDRAVIQGDVGPIQQALLNLGINASDAIGSNGGVVELSLQSIEITNPARAIDGVVSPGCYYRVRVSDNGEGMDKEVLAHMLEPFFTTKPVGKGTGLGLPMVRSIVQAHGGRLCVESRKGAGTTFDLYFPTLQEEVLNVQNSGGR